MEYGSFLTATVASPRPAGNFAYKGVAIRVGPQQYKGNDAGVVFDTDLLRYSAGWIGDYLNLTGVALDGTHWAYPSINGEQIFGNPQSPGWAGPEGFDDPREFPYGPIPRDWALP